MTPEQQTQYWKRYARQNAKYERYGVKLFSKAIADSIAPIIRHVQEFGATNETIDRYFDPLPIQQAYTTFYTQVGNRHRVWTLQDSRARIKAVDAFLITKEDDRGRSSSTGNATLGVGFENPSWLARLRNLVNGFDAASRVTSVTNTIKKRLQNTLGRAMQTELSPRGIARMLREEVPGLSRKRAELIARTETTFVANLAAEESSREVATAVGIDLVKVWIATRDSRTRDAHRAMIGKRPVNSFEKFVVGGTRMDKPGDPAGGVRNCANCRCTVAYLPADDYGDLF